MQMWHTIIIIIVNLDPFTPSPSCLVNNFCKIGISYIEMSIFNIRSIFIQNRKECICPFQHFPHFNYQRTIGRSTFAKILKKTWYFSCNMFFERMFPSNPAQVLSDPAWKTIKSHPETLRLLTILLFKQYILFETTWKLYFINMNIII